MSQQQNSRGPAPDRRGEINREVALAPEVRLRVSQDALDRRKISPEGWNVLCDAIFPSAKTAQAVLLAIDLCKARNYDIFRKPVHIVPVWSSQHKRQVETVWPGINSIQADAAATGAWAGMDAPEFGPIQKKKFAGQLKKWDNGYERRESVEAEVSFPEWCSVTVYRVVHGQRCPFTVPVYWEEAYATIGGSKLPNDMWQKRPRGQLIKCATAASLRAAFPEAPDMSAEEMEGQTVDGGGVVIPGEAEDVTNAAPVRQSRGPVDAPQPPPREPEPWEAMAWPYALPDGTYEDMGKPDPWVDAFRQRLQKILDAQQLPADAKAKQYDKLASSHQPIFVALNERGGEAAVSMATALIDAAKAGEPLPRDPSDPTVKPERLSLVGFDKKPAYFAAGEGLPPIEQQWLAAWRQNLARISGASGLHGWRAANAAAFGDVDQHWKEAANAAHDSFQARLRAIEAAAAERAAQGAPAK